MQPNFLPNAVQGLTATAFLSHWFLLAREASYAWNQSDRRRRQAASVVFGAVSVLILLATSDTTLRGGHSNDHDFHIMASSFFDWEWTPFLPLSKELSSRAMFTLADLASAHSLQGILTAQKLLWALCGLLIYSALRKAGSGAEAAVLGAGFFSLNFLAILSTYSFSTANTNIFYVCSAICALTGIFSDQEHPQREGHHLAWFMVAGFLVFTSRLEFFPVLLLGLVLALALPGRRPLSVLWNGPKPAARAAGALLTVIFLAACGAWGFLLLDIPPAVGKSNPAPLSNLMSHWGDYNLTMLTGVSPRTVLWIAALLVLVAAAAAKPGRQRLLLFRFWLPLLGVWGIYFATLYPSISLFRLEAVRHHVYFFLPLVFLLGCAVDAAWSRLPEMVSMRMRWTLTAGLAAIYCVANIRLVYALQPEWRTNDREWRFLYEAQRLWPQGCRAVYPFIDDRGALLRRYFPYAPLADAATDGCCLIYRSPVTQIFGQKKPESYRVLDPDKHGAWYRNPWREEVFEHRCYTDFRGPDGETCKPIAVRVGFYRLPDSERKDPAFRVFAADLLLIQSLRRTYTKGQREAALADLARAQAVTKSVAMSRADRAKFLNDQGVLEASLGHSQEAIRDLRQTISLNAGFLPAHITLAGLYISSGRLNDALKVCDSALAAPPVPAYHQMREMIRVDRQKLLHELAAPSHGHSQ